MGQQVDEKVLQRALAELEASTPGVPSGPAVVGLIAHLAPVIFARVASVVSRASASRSSADLRQEIEDQVQSTFVELFERRWCLLRRWDPTAGVSLRSWVGRLARLRALDAIRARRRGPWRAPPHEPEVFERIAHNRKNPEEVWAAQEVWRETRRRVLAEQSDLGRRMFELLIEQGLSTDEVRQHTARSDAAIFQWRRRLRNSIRREMREVTSVRPHPT